MAQTPEGAKKALETKRKRYGQHYITQQMQKAGRISGMKKDHPGRFVKGSDRAKQAGLKGASIRHGGSYDRSS